MIPELREALDGLLARPEWHDRAACRGKGTADYFPSQGGNTSNAARAICADCPVIAECLEYALAVPAALNHGTWGGTSARERRRILRQRRTAAA